ncbi:MAG: ROK family protein, partial [Lachnospiraceae bacterium]
YFCFLMDQAYQSALLVSPYYGVGMAYMHNRKIFYSKGRHQCELGHITVRPGATKCNCGKRGCLEMYASPLGLATYSVTLSKECIQFCFP